MDRIQSLLPAALLGFAFLAQPAVPKDVTAQPSGLTPSAGAQVYGKWCSDCHSTPTGPGSLALQRKYQGKVPAILEQRSDLAPAYVKFVVRHGISFMPSFRKTEISDSELELMTAYLVSAHGHRAPTAEPEASQRK